MQLEAIDAGLERLAAQSIGVAHVRGLLRLP
jgi:hypothetical protein